MDKLVGGRQYAVGGSQGLEIRSQESGISDQKSFLAVGGSPRSSKSGTPCSSRVNRTGRRGFTLVEMLVVIVIIGVLAGLIVAAAGPAIRSAKRLTITTEIGQLDMALQKYQQEYGEYPPDFCGLGSTDPSATQAAILRHLRRAFPRYRPGSNPGATGASDWDLLRYDVEYATRPSSGSGMELNQMRGPGALVFFLGGVDIPGTSTKLDGFSANPANPFAVGGSRKPLLFEFDEDRLVQPNGTQVYAYVPPNVKDPDGGDAIPPYVYFKANRDSYDPTLDGNAQFFPWGDTYCTPYGKDYISTPSVSYKWFNPNKCQIVCCGLNGMYAEPEAAGATSPARPYRYLQVDSQPDTGNLKPEEDDNLTNFTQGKLEDWSKGN